MQMDVGGANGIVRARVRAQAFKKAELTAAQKENDVVDDHHVGRRWAETLALMTRHTGAYRELEGVCKTPYGGIDEDGVDLWIPENRAREQACQTPGQLALQHHI